VLRKQLLDATTGHAARGVIRAAFRDRGTLNTASVGGSLFVAQEYNQPEKNDLQTIAVHLGNLAQHFNIGVVDMIQFAACRLPPSTKE
jgi:hypothetical protein